MAMGLSLNEPQEVRHPMELTTNWLAGVWRSFHQRRVTGAPHGPRSARGCGLESCCDETKWPRARYTRRGMGARVAWRASSGWACIWQAAV